MPGVTAKDMILHLIGDAAVSAGVVLAGAAIVLTGWHWLDPLVSLMISAVIVWLAWGLLKEATSLSLDAVPAAIDPEAVRTCLCQLPGVESIHDLHIWAMSTVETAMTVHLVMPQGHPGDAFIAGACDAVRKKFGIGHATFQIETGAMACELAPDHVV